MFGEFRVALAHFVGEAFEEIDDLVVVEAILFGLEVGSKFVNDAAENLNLNPWYNGDEVPKGQSLIWHIRKSTREQITQMFLEANEPLFEIADDHDYFPDKAEIAIDITDWPYYGDPDSDDYVRGIKPGRNYARAWKYSA